LEDAGVSASSARGSAGGPSEEYILGAAYAKDWYTQKKLFRVLVSAGFEAERIRILTQPVRYRGKDLDDLLDILRTAFLGQVTNGWSEEEKEQWIKELFNALTEQEKQRASLEMIAWVAVAQK
jgi:ribosomal protein L12E/L44/L45/RPP1/RPP2